MPVFPSKEWCEEAANLANSDPESALAGDGWEGDFGAVVEAEAGKLARPFAVYACPLAGRIETLKVLADPDDLDELEPAYLARAPYSVWKGLILGTVDPVEAVLTRRVQVRGNLQPLIERMKYKGIADRVLQRLETRFADEI